MQASLTDYRADAYAVVAGLQFLQPAVDRCGTGVELTGEGREGKEWIPARADEPKSP